jgi:polysaccharide biosynthesis protein PslF
VNARNYSQDVIFRLRQNERDDYYAVAEIANSEAFDVINIQHEFGIFGGMYGEYVVALLAAIRKPVVITMHT